jgi:hypothetical protein
MQLGVPKELHPGENRVPMTPGYGQETGATRRHGAHRGRHGRGSGYKDAEYRSRRRDGQRSRRPALQLRYAAAAAQAAVEEIAQMKRGCIHISYLDPFNEHDLVRAFAEAGVTAISMEMIPRSTRSQKMDALSSQANLAGYIMVMLAATHLPRIFPDDDDARGHAEAGQGVHHRRRCRRPAGHRHGQAPRRPGHGFRHALGGGRAGAVPRRQLPGDRSRRDRPDQGRLRQGADAGAGQKQRTHRPRSSPSPTW